MRDLGYVEGKDFVVEWRFAAGHLPVEQPTRFYLTVNQRTAKILGLTLSPALLLRADEVIQ